MGRKRQWPSPLVPERNQQFALHLSRLLSDASLGPRELAALLGRTEVLIYKYYAQTEAMASSRSKSLPVQCSPSRNSP